MQDRRNFLRLCFLTGFSVAEFPRMQQLGLVPRASGALVEADLVLKNATIYDGTGKPGYLGHMAVKGNRIVAMGRFPTQGRPTTIDLHGLCLAPGFIDLDPMASHVGDDQSLLAQGITTVALSASSTFGGRSVNKVSWQSAPGMSVHRFPAHDPHGWLVELLESQITPRLHLSGLPQAELTEILDTIGQARFSGRRVTVDQSPFDDALSHDELQRVFQLPFTATVSRGRSMAFPTRIAEFAFREKAQPLAIAIRSCSAVPAEILSLCDRGYLRPGYVADLVAFDPKPSRLSDPVQYVVIDGRIAYDHGNVHTPHMGRHLTGGPAHRP